MHACGVAPSNAETTAKLLENHPQNVALPGPVQDLKQVSAPTIAKSEVLEAIASFKKGTGCGRTGMRAEHLKQLYNGDNDIFLTNLTHTIQIAIDGKAPLDFAPFMASGSLVPLFKKDNTIRPITVGEIFRRLASKCLLKHSIARARQILKPLQYGVGVPNCIEEILNGLNAMLDDEELPEEATIILIDFTNAFNLSDRNAMFEAVNKDFPELNSWI